MTATFSPEASLRDARSKDRHPSLEMRIIQVQPDDTTTTAGKQDYNKITCG